MKRPSGCERLLALLSDGGWHNHHAVYGLNIVGHSRISELRRRGYSIECRTHGTDREGNTLYEYRLLPQLTLDVAS